MAVNAINSLFSNERVDPADKKKMVQGVMKNVWNMLLSDGEVGIPGLLLIQSPFQNLIDDVSSLLDDLLGIIQTWLCVEATAILNSDQFRHVVSILEPTKIRTTVRAMECIFVTLSKGSELTDDVEIDA